MYVKLLQRITKNNKLIKKKKRFQFKKEKDGYLLHQHNYLENILVKFNIDKYKIASNMRLENKEE